MSVTKSEKCMKINVITKEDLKEEKEKQDNEENEDILVDADTKVKRNHKDTVFVDLFSKDDTAKSNLISLVNALYDCNLDENKVSYKITRLENVLYTAMQNDIGVLIDNKFLVLGEHQSTWNENMPLRCLMYVSRIYENIVEKNDRYSGKLIKIPYPQFFVFYNGYMYARLVYKKQRII